MKGNCRREKKSSSKKFFSEGFSRSFCRSQQAPQKFKNMYPNPKRFSFIEKNVRGDCKQIYTQKKK